MKTTIPPSAQSRLDEARARLEELRSQRAETREAIQRVDTTIDGKVGELGHVADRYDQAEARAAGLEGRICRAQVGEAIGARWKQATAALGRGLVNLGAKLGQRSFSVTVTDIEKDPTAAKTSEVLREELGMVERDLDKIGDQLASYASALGELRGERDELKSTLQAHGKAIRHAWGELVEAKANYKVQAGLAAAGAAIEATTEFASDTYRALRREVFSGIKQVSYRVANWAAEAEKSAVKGDAEQLSSLAAPTQALEQSIGRTVRCLPVPVPVPANREPPSSPVQAPAGSEVPTGSAASAEKPVRPSRAEAAVDAGFGTVDARSVYALPDPKTGREWVALAAGIDFTEARAHGAPHARDLDAVMKTQGLLNMYRGKSAKDAKRAVTKRLGLKEQSTPADVRREVDRRLSAGVDSMLPKKAFDQHLAKLGLPADAPPQAIVQATLDRAG